MSRRATVIEQLKEQGPVITVDAGNLFYKSPKLSPALVAQQRIKAELQAAAYQRSGLDAFTPGAGDFAIGLDESLDLIDRYELPAVAAGLRCGDRDFDGSRVVERGGLSVGIIGVVDLGEAAARDGSPSAGCESGDPVAAAVAAAAAMGPVDLTVLLVQGPESLDQQLAQAVPGADVVINGQTRRTNQAARDLGGGVWQLGDGSRGKRLGVLHLEPSPGAQGWISGDAVAGLERRLERYGERLSGAEKRAAQAADGSDRERADRLVESYRAKLETLKAELAQVQAEGGGGANTLRHELVDLGTDVPDHPATTALVTAALERITQVESAQVPPTPASPTLQTGPFAGALACGTCHAAEAAQWETTAHARAYATLEAEHRQMDQACFGCHVTGAEHPAGPQRPAEVSQRLQAVGCESCHGPARAHAENPARAAPPPAQVPETTCVRCHDGSRDEGRFDYTSYLSKITHSGQGLP